MTFFCDLFLEGGEKTQTKTNLSTDKSRNPKIGCSIKNNNKPQIHFISSHRRLSEGTGNPALTTNLGVHFTCQVVNSTLSAE